MSHFAYLLSYVDKDQYPQLYLVLDLGVQAEKYLLTDTNIALVKLRQLNESFVKLVAQKNDISLEQYDETKSRSIELSVASLIHQITSKLNISNYTRELFYKILEVGNEAVHNPLYDDVEVARHRLQDAYDIVYVFLCGTMHQETSHNVHWFLKMNRPYPMSCHQSRQHQRVI